MFLRDKARAAERKNIPSLRCSWARWCVPAGFLCAGGSHSKARSLPKQLEVIVSLLLVVTCLYYQQVYSSLVFRLFPSVDA
jgi:hypothetical protein